MIDIRELQKRGVVRIPKEDIDIPTNREGFIEMGESKKSTTISNSDFFGFANITSQIPKEQPTTKPNELTISYNKRETDKKITDLDNKIYKLEQRIELLEKKLDVNQPSNKVGVMGW